MAIGDDAIAAGITLVPGTALAKDIDEWINRLADEVARRSMATLSIARGGTGSTTAAGARAALGIPDWTYNVEANKLVSRAPDGFFSVADAQQGVHPVPLGQLTTLLASKADASVGGTASDAYTRATEAKQGRLWSDTYNRTLSGSYRVCYVGADGSLGWVSSSRTAKEDIELAPIDVQAVLAMEVVTYHRIGAPDGDIEHGLIAEDLHELGLTWLVDYGADGDTPQGVRYDLLALALIPALQHLLRRLADAEASASALETRVAAIEAHLDALGGDLDA